MTTKAKKDDFFDSHIVFDMPDSWGKDKKDGFKKAIKKKLVEKLNPPGRKSYNESRTV